ncbi:MAG: hypothetical protein IJM21_06145, partial [Clostridia bacterium]|nr:hypothetical protein [Clostridia bacterium]
IRLEEMRFGQKQPVQENDIERFPHIEHDDKAEEKLPEAKAVLYPVIVAVPSPDFFRAEIEKPSPQSFRF